MIKTNKKKIIKKNLFLLNILKNNKNLINKNIKNNNNLSQKQILFNSLKLKKNIFKEICMITGKTKALTKIFKINRCITNRFIQFNLIANIINNSKQ